MHQDLARNKQTTHRFGRPLDDGISWPSDGAEAASMLRRQASGMVRDLGRVRESYASRLRGAAGSLPEAGELAAEVEREGVNAAARVRDALREMLFVVLLASLHREGRLAAQQRGDSGGEGGREGPEEQPQNHQEAQQPGAQVSPSPDGSSAGGGHLAGANPEQQRVAQPEQGPESSSDRKQLQAM
jgi:hypothetical protein